MAALARNVIVRPLPTHPPNFSSLRPAFRESVLRSTPIFLGRPEMRPVAGRVPHQRIEFHLPTTIIPPDICGLTPRVSLRLGSQVSISYDYPFEIVNNLTPLKFSARAMVT
jgi:hypothetical protein